MSARIDPNSPRLNHAVPSSRRMAYAFLESLGQRLRVTLVEAGRYRA